jgi:hypothetical protein
MGETRAGMNGGDGPDRAAEKPRGSQPDGGEGAEVSIERQIEALRDDIGEMVSELDRRRHEALDVRLQVRRHSGALMAIGAVGVVLAFGAYRAWAAAQRRREQPIQRLQNLARVLLLVSRDPERLERAMEGRQQRGSLAATALGKAAGAAGKRAILGAAG